MPIRITVLPGDGIGPEIMAAAMEVLDFVSRKFDIEFELTERSIGGASYEKFGVPLTDDTLQTCLNSDIVLLGAVGGYQWESLEHHLKPEAALLKLRKSLGLFANIRPAKPYQALLDGSSLKKEILQSTDFVVVRELTGGIYFGEPRGIEQNRGWNTMVYSRHEIERIAKIGFDLAMKRKKQLVSVDKANVLDCSQFWRSVVTQMHRKYPEVELRHLYVDNAAMQIVRDPGQFDVILTSNLFGDILSDIAGMITGSLGMLPSASLGEKYALYEPVHGSAPDIAGKNQANPIAMIASLAMMFRYSVSLPKAAVMIESAIEKSLAQGYRTADIAADGEKVVSTTEMTKIILENMN